VTEPHSPSPLQVPAAWDAVAPTYAEDVAQWRAFADEALRLLPIASTDRVLDVASGPGTLAVLAAPRAAYVAAIDFSPGMIEQLRKKAAQAKLSRLEACVMDAQHLEFRDASFDKAYSLFGFFFFPDRARAFRELHRVLKPGARALIGTWSPIERRPLMKIALDALAEALPHLPRPAKGDLQDPEECVGEMRGAGFRDVEASLFAASLRIESPERYLELIVRSGALFAAMRKRVDEAAWNDAMARVLGVLRRKLADGPTDLGAEAIFTVGTR
jgi:ubiquinone/menaquinone biosynthesis C-methylase UbiE